MKIEKFIVAVIVSLTISTVAEAQAANRPSAPENPEALRQVLANQPDYVAARQFIFSEGFGGFGANSKVAKLGRRRREETDDTVFINESGKPTVKVYPKRKEYSEQPVEADGDSQFSPEGLAGRDDVNFKLLGREKVGGYDCLKIEVTYKDERLREMVFVFYAAPALRNLVIREEISLGEQVKFITQLSGVSFNVPGKLFAIPAGYKKVVEPKPFP